MHESIIGCLERAMVQYGDKVGMIDGDLKLTYREFGENVYRLANGLRAFGVRKGDAVAAICVNHHRYLQIYFACHALGAIINPLNVRLEADELIYIINDSKSRVLFTDKPFLPMIEKVKEGTGWTLEEVFYSDGDAPPEGMRTLADLMKDQPAEFEKPEIAETDIAGYFYTGGTTGLPKGVMLTVRNIMSNAFHLQAMMRHTPDDLYLHIAPMFHLADAGSFYALTMTGGTHVFGRAFEPKLCLELIQKHRVTSILLVPTMLNFVLSHPDFAKYDIKSLRYILYGASPMPVPLLKKAIANLPCLPVQGYGMTEAAPLVTVLTGPEHKMALETPGKEWILGTAGRSVPGVEIKIVGEDGKEVAVGEAGEILVRGPNVMKGYLNKEEATAEAIVDGWYHSGDVAVRNESGYVTIVDRKKDMIISGGENIYTTEVENVLMQFAGILETTVIGVPHEKWGETVKAFVVLKEGHDGCEETIIEFCKERLAHFKCPTSVDFIDALPKSGAGKILKRELRAQFWGEGRQVN